ncbi:hypothetical protein FA09DRAFT_339330 [Tilletiopsis washingtonensis]|uniref:Uncharacterized protein n=1 Tax=Tilletiopsis washingtonensis TaxID=58919 RepID=A0A316Z6A3_9BASI|nr:hypothetical protein FA09DRAFT_339330 [Tilletiopsis washingtonensis]PWN97320.1 hypothetical protein FA09DRAFT_339330 [Tilletiopsis washingtonensis]
MSTATHVESVAAPGAPPPPYAPAPSASAHGEQQQASPRRPSVASTLQDSGASSASLSSSSSNGDCKSQATLTTHAAPPSSSGAYASFNPHVYTLPIAAGPSASAPLPSAPVHLAVQGFAHRQDRFVVRNALAEGVPVVLSTDEETQATGWQARLSAAGEKTGFVVRQHATSKQYELVDADGRCRAVSGKKSSLKMRFSVAGPEDGSTWTWKGAAFGTLALKSSGTSAGKVLLAEYTRGPQQTSSLVVHAAAGTHVMLVVASLLPALDAARATYEKNHWETAGSREAPGAPSEFETRVWARKPKASGSSSAAPSSDEPEPRKRSLASFLLPGRNRDKSASRDSSPAPDKA